jgi:hypothetical protein
MTCTLPCLKQFLAMFESGMIGEYSGSGSGMNTAASGYGYTSGSGGYGSGSRKGSRTDRSGSIALVEISRGGHGAAGTVVINRPQAGARHRPTSSSSSSSEIGIVLRPDHNIGDYSVASVSAAAAADASSFVSDRSGAAMIIKKTQKWEVSSRERWCKTGLANVHDWV